MTTDKVDGRGVSSGMKSERKNTYNKANLKLEYPKFNG